MKFHVRAVIDTKPEYVGIVETSGQHDLDDIVGVLENMKDDWIIVEKDNKKSLIPFKNVVKLELIE